MTLIEAKRQTLLALVLSQTKKFVLACAGVRKRWKCAVVDGVLFTPPVRLWWLIRSVVAYPPQVTGKCLAPLVLAPR